MAGDTLPLPLRACHDVSSLNSNLDRKFLKEALNTQAEEPRFALICSFAGGQLVAANAVPIFYVRATR